MTNPFETAFLRAPVKLSADVFTPLTRTPWAGTAIARRFKSAMPGVMPATRIGESWDFSCDPAFPSRVVGRAETLLELVRRFPEETLSPSLAGKGACEILVKLIHADMPLSVQVHPADSDPDLKKGECGKPESWLVLDAEPGAGLYLGFSRSMNRDALRELLASGTSSPDWLQFVPVRAGDYFEIAPGVPHAIGPGVLLLEPQRILQGQSGKTYRLWDWGRKYDSSGLVDSARGQPRELHLEASLRLMDPSTQVGASYADSLRRGCERRTPALGLTWEIFPANEYYQLHRVKAAGKRSARLSIRDGYGALLMLDGALQMGSGDERMVVLGRGEPALLPHHAMPLDVEIGNGADVVVVIPAGASLEVSSR
jgi:mannose-6-phosphate isomerase